MRWGGHVAEMGGGKKFICGFGREAWGKRITLKREDNIKTDLQEVALVNVVIKLGVPHNAGNLTTWEPGSSSRRTLHHAVSCM